MLNSLPLRSKSPGPALVPTTSTGKGAPQAGVPSQAPIPSIRLITATPSATGLSSEASSSFAFNRSLEESWATMPSISSIPSGSALAPKSDVDARRRLVPKKSKLNILGLGTGGRDKKEDRAKDLSDVVRRIGISENMGDYSTGRGGFEIYVDPTVDPEIGDIVMVKKKKSRVALNGMAWGAMGEVTNVPKTKEGKEMKENPGLLKVKSDDEKKWWSIGRGRKDSKEKKEKEKENKISHKPVEYIHHPPSSKTPETIGKPTQDTRARFNSFDSGVLLNGGMTRSLSPSPGALPAETSSNTTNARRIPTPTPSLPPAPSRIIPMPMDDDEDDRRPEPITYSRSTTPTFGGLLAPPNANGENAGSGSIALRAIRSVRSLARMGSWGQLKPNPNAEEEVTGTVREKKDKSTKEKGSKKKKAKENLTGEEGKDGKKKSTKKKSTKKEKESEKELTQPARQSSSSFEIGALSASPVAVRDPLNRASMSSANSNTNSKTLGAKKASTLLGIGLPSSMRLPSVRSGSTASSNYGLPLNSSNPNINIQPPSATISNNRLSVESAHSNVQRPASSLSSGSSLRPVSTTSTNSRLSSGSSAASVRWDEQGLETVREQRNKEREIKARSREMAEEDEKKERRTSRESKHSIEGRRRTALSSVFPEVRQSFDEVEIGREMVRDVEMDVEDEPEIHVMNEERNEEEEEEVLRKWSYPILTIEEATSDGHGRPDSYDGLIAHYEGSEESHDGMQEEEDQPMVDATPVKKARPRPLSEQLLGRSRPKPMYEDEEGVLSILDAATNDLALLIKTLDLQATPSTPDMTPLRPSASASPSPTPVSTLEKVKASITGSPKGKKKKNVTESPLSAKSNKKKPDLLRQISTSSINSIRPYAQSRGYPSKAPLASSVEGNAANAALISKQIAPWATLMKGLSPVKEKPAASTIRKNIVKAASPPSTIAFRPGHKRTMTPGPEPEPEPVLQPLHPAKSRLAIKTKFLKVNKSPEPEKVQEQMPVDDDEELTRAPASLTFGRSSSRGTVRLSRTSEEYTGSLTPVFQRIQDYERKTSLSPSEALSIGRSSRGSRSSKGSHSSYGSQLASDAPMPISRETRRVLGMSGTMGGSDVSCYRDSEPLDVSDPDSDVPDELRHILATATNSPRASVVDVQDVEVEDEGHTEIDISMDMEEGEIEVARSARFQTAFLPPTLPLNIPKFKAELVDERENHFDVDDYPTSPTSEEDTKKSFDFTGELQKLNESGGSDRRSFVEQLENAFRTPAKIDLRYDFGVDAPPVPELPLSLKMAIEAASESSAATTEDSASSGFGEFDSHSQLVNMQFPSVVIKNDSVDPQESKSNVESKSQFDMFTASRIVDVKEPTMFQGADSLDGNESDDILAKRKLTESTSSRTSEGELNTSFRFGGLPCLESSTSLPTLEKPLTLSDIIPPPSHARSLSGIDDSVSAMLEDDSVLRSIYGHMVEELAQQPRPRVSSDSSIDLSVLEKRRSIYKASSRPTSGISFNGYAGFEDVRRAFEFHPERPGFYPPSEPNRSHNTSRRPQHNRYESNFSIASVSSYGHVTKAGSADPFDFGIPVPPLPSLQESPSTEPDENLTHMTYDTDKVDDTFAYRKGINQQRRRVESDASSFYFRPIQPQKGARGHHRRESNFSVSSQAPPISLYNRSFGHHRRNDSSASTSSVAMSYIKHGANGGISAWARHHRKDQSVDSVSSDFAALQLGRPGIGDKMFDHQDEHGPLTSITASPPESASASQQQFVRRRSFDSIMDGEDEIGQRNSMSMVEDSIFDKTGFQSRTTASESDSAVFGPAREDDFARLYRTVLNNAGGQGLMAPRQYRRISQVIPLQPHEIVILPAARDDDTMISMLGGGHARRCSVGSIVEASPCVRAEKRKHPEVQPAHMRKGFDHYDESPNKARIVEKPSIASTASFHFGGERMIRAQRGLLERQSLEEHCLTAEGEDLSVSYHAIPVFTRPGPAGRSRSSTCTSSSGVDTPPLSASDGSSISEGSQSSIDLSQINIALSNATHPISSMARDRVRARARGTGHRRRYSKSHVSRSSVYETIEEEQNHSNQTSPAHSLVSKKDDSPTTTQAVFIVDSDTASLCTKPEESVWDDERGIVALRKYYALRDEAQNTVDESRKLWLDTPFSLYAIQSFQAPGSPAGMQALLEHSVQNYGPLPSEHRAHRRTRTSSRPSPYPQARISKTNLSPEKKRSTNLNGQRTPVVLQTLPVNVHTGKTPRAKGSKKTSDAPSLSELKAFSPFSLDVEPKGENAFGLSTIRPRVGSSARRTALGWSKRSNGPKSSTEQKENTSIVITTPGENLRFNRPRPRGRPTPGGRTPAASANRPPMPTSTNRPIRI